MGVLYRVFYLAPSRGDAQEIDPRAQFLCISTSHAAQNPRRLSLKLGKFQFWRQMYKRRCTSLNAKDPRADYEIGASSGELRQSKGERAMGRMRPEMATRTGIAKLGGTGRPPFPRWNNSNGSWDICTRSEGRTGPGTGQQPEADHRENPLAECRALQRSRTAAEPGTAVLV
jgi:hypothetical protein